MKNHIKQTPNTNVSGSLKRTEPKPEMDLAFLTQQFEKRQQRKLHNLQQKIQKVTDLKGSE